MSRMTTLTVRLGGLLSDFVAENVGETGAFENVSEYVRDLIHKEQERLKLRGLLLAGAAAEVQAPASPAYFEGLRDRVRQSVKADVGR